MSLLDKPGDSESSLESLGKGRFEPKAPFSSFVNDENDEDLSMGWKEKGKARHGDVDPQKNTFSLRRKHKEKDKEKTRHTRNKSFSRSPPESPKHKHPEPGRKGSKNPAASPRSHRKDYAHLLENDFSSGEDEEEFLLSKGHVAREKRVSAVGSKTPPRDLHPSANSRQPAAGTNLSFVASSPSHPSALDSKASFTSSLPPTVGPSSVQAFPVQFVESNETPLPDDQPLSPERGGLTSGGILSFDGSFSSPALHSHSPPASSQPPVIPLLPPPPSVTSATSVCSGIVSGSLSATSYPPSAVLFPPLGGSQTSPFLEQNQPVIEPSPPVPVADWSVSQELQQKCVEQFKQIQSGEGLLSGEAARGFFLQSKLPVDELSKIWKLSDMDKDGCLSMEEFIVAMKLVMMRRGNHEIPTTLPEELLKLTLKKTPKESPSPPFKFSFPPPPSKSSKAHGMSVRLSPARPQSQTESGVPTVSSAVTVTSSDFDRQTEAVHRTRSLGFDSTTSSRYDEEKDTIKHVVTADDHPYALGNIANKNKKPPEEGKLSLFDTSFTSDGPWNTSREDTTEPSIIISEASDPALGHLVSIDNGSSPEDSDDVLNLVEEPKEWPQKKRLGKSRSQHSRKPAPSRAIPYPNRSRSSTSPPPLSSDDDSLSPHNASPSQFADSDTQLMLSAGKIAPPKPAPPKTRPKPAWITKAQTEKQLPMVREGEDVPDGLFSLSFFKASAAETRPKEGPGEEEEEQGKEKTHNRSTSWDLTKMIREEHVMSVHQDLPSAEPPKPPPRRPLSDPKDENTLQPLQRSASTGSLASTGTPAVLQKSRSPSTGSGSLVAALELTQMDLLPGKARRPAPAPPPKKSKKPIFPPTHKKIEPEVPSITDDSDDRPLLIDSYLKKSKKELLQEISQLKEDNTLYSQMNEHLNDKLNQLIKQRTQLEIRLQALQSSSSSSLA